MMTRLIYLSLLVLFSSSIKAQITSIPDSKFEQSLIDQGIDSDGIINGQVLTSDVAALTYLDVSGNDIIQLTGIEDFTNLTELHCQRNQLTSLTLGANKKLNLLNCSENMLTSLSLKDLEDLRILNCSSNKISEINVSGNELLEEFQCQHNLLQTLNLKNNLELTLLNCSSNRFSVLNITFNWKLKYLDFSSNLFQYIDLVNCVRLEFLNCSDNPLTSVFLNNMTELQKVYLVENDFLQQVNFSHNHKLKEIVCRENDQLESINLSATLALEYLDCSNNSLTELQTIYNPLLENLYCQGNLIKDLDLSQNQNLAFLKCNDNELESLDLKNGFNALMTGGMTYYNGDYVYMNGMDSSNNPSLFCIQVDDEETANQGIAPYDSWVKDGITSYSENCEANLGIEQEELSRAIQVYPNPAQEAITIEKDPWDINRVILYSIQGRKIKQFDSHFETIALNDISSGLYFLLIYTEKGVAVKRIVKR